MWWWQQHNSVVADLTNVFVVVVSRLFGGAGNVRVDRQGVSRGISRTSLSTLIGMTKVIRGAENSFKQVPDPFSSAALCKI